MFIKHLSIAALLLSGATAAYADDFRRGGFDSVNQDFEEIVADINDGFATGSARFANIAINTGDVDASVNINADLDEGGVVSSFRGGLLDIDLAASSAEIAGGADAIEGGLTIAGVEMVEEIDEASNMSMGSISTLAAGALNTVTMDLTETAAASSFDVASGSVAAAGSTASTSAYDLLTSRSSGSGLSSVAAAYNVADIKASVSLDLEDGNYAFVGAAQDVVGSLTTTSFVGVSTLAAGALNTADVTAAFVSTGSRSRD
ncbi:hypothetical protein CCR83_08650 [Rhodobacter veldkampii DSM 11550]|uniref:Porin n=1 Tax=Phaeovulum veldkampii DSM 11550 TaxID=1185920 RepID=A0A2T4JFR3_9RHOB|nr:hypothetical protein [Phaeovulum veldkampii]MBK5946496.1 hypothetical protein [Phaeovulum veldkampii DSM 11550]PTE16741.1 hypothetical protein C5F46_12795 [Phaeovulum veldkampii DSM 11550]